MSFFMYENLPEELKQQVAGFLAREDFVSAKKVYDGWFCVHSMNDFEAIGQELM